MVIIKREIDNFFIEVNRVHEGKLNFKFDPTRRCIICNILQDVKPEDEEQNKNLINIIDTLKAPSHKSYTTSNKVIKIRRSETFKEILPSALKGMFIKQ
jgi:hypothetical protein